MKVAEKWIRIVQGTTVAVYRYQAGKTCLAVQVHHREPKPVLFRKAAGRNFNKTYHIAAESVM